MKIIEYLSILIFIPVLIIVYVFRPLIFIRWFPYDTGSRIGTLIPSIESFYLKKKNNNKLEIELFCSENFCNDFLNLKYKRKKIIFTRPLIVKLLSKTNNFFIKYFKYQNNHEINKNEIYKRINYEDYSKKNFLLSINLNDDEKGKNFLKQLGLHIKSKIICLIIRDESYLKKNFPNSNWDYHSYRNSNIENYIDSINFLLKKGYIVFRMGKISEKKINVKHKNFFDYSNSNYRSDFLDIWLLKRCDLCISTSSGLDEVARLFCKPTIIVNFVNFYSFNSFSQTITYPKILKKNGKNLETVDYFNLKNVFGKSEDFKKNNIEIKEYNKNELLEIFKEAIQIFENQWKFRNQEDILYQNIFWQRFKENRKQDKLLADHHRYINKKSIIGPYFLKKMKNRKFYEKIN